MNRTFALLLILGMILGIAAGVAIHETLDTATAKNVTDVFDLITFTFLRLVKMIIAPLVFTTLVMGIAHMEDAAEVGRVGVRTILWFVFASLVSLALGLLFVHLFEPGVGLALPAAKPVPVNADALTIKEFITHLVPRSIIEAMATNEILQIVVFSVFVGVAVAALDNRAPQVMQLIEQIAAIMLKVTAYVMMLAPVVVFAALASAIAAQGADVLLTYAKFVGGFYVALIVLWLLLFTVAFLFWRGRAGVLFKAIREPVLLAFSAASSEAAYPKLLENLQAIGLPKQIVNFVLPLGYSFNLDGSMMYCTFATLFIAQAYGIDLSLGQQITLLLVMMITTKGMAGVPKASIVVIMATLPYFNIPADAVMLVFAVDQLLDMGRSGTNIVGNSVACVVVNAWSGKRAVAPPAT